MNYDAQMDPECIPLCDAINNIPCLYTTDSCCGHGKESFKIWVKGIRHRNILILLRALDIRYGGPHDWTAEMAMDDMEDEPEYLFISSGYFRGERAYGQAQQVVKNIQAALENESFQKLFGVGKYLGD